MLPLIENLHKKKKVLRVGVGSESLSIPTPLRRAPQIYHVSMSDNLSFNPTTLHTMTDHSSQRFRSHSPVCHHLAFSIYDEKSPVRTSDPHLWHPSMPDGSPLHGRAEPPLPVQHHIHYHHTSTPSIDIYFQDATAEDFPTAPLDDTILFEY